MAISGIDLESIANVIGSGSCAWAHAKDESDQVEEVKYFELVENMCDPEPLQGVIRDTIKYLLGSFGVGIKYK